MTSSRLYRAEQLCAALQRSFPELGRAEGVPKEVPGNCGLYSLRFACAELEVTDEVLDHEDDWSIPKMVERIRADLAALLLKTLMPDQTPGRYRLAEDSEKTGLVVYPVPNE